MTGETSMQPAYFDALYAADADPWRFATSDYERDKYKATLDVIAGLSPGRIFEVGCSIGVLTRQIARLGGSVLSVDVAEAALAGARARCAGLENVELRRMQVPGAWPDGVFDLILLSEVLYYLSDADLVATASAARDGLAARGSILLVHYVKPTNYPHSGDAAVEMFIAAGQFRRVLARRTEDYRLDLLAP